jgi:hypothetical protein
MESGIWCIEEIVGLADSTMRAKAPLGGAASIELDYCFGESVSSPCP